MYISYDYKCPACEVIEHRFVDKEYKDDQHCEDCQSLMIRLPSATKTTFKFNDK